MLDDETFLLSTTFEEFLVRIERFAGPPTAEQRTLAGRVLFELRFGLEMRDPRVVEAAQQLLHALDGGGPFLPRSLGPSLADASFEAELFRRIEDELERGRLVVEQRQIRQLSDQRDLDFPELPPLPPPRREPNTQTFEVRFLDEVGKAISGVDAEFNAGGAQVRTTNSAGVALLESVPATSATVSILDVDALSNVLEPRWETFRPGKPPKESNTQEVVFRGTPLGPFSIKGALPNTVVVKPSLGKLFVELFDKTGRVRHAKQAFEITGPQTFEGTTDEDGRLLKQDVLPGNYELTLTVDNERLSCPLVVLDNAAGPQVRRLGAVPFVQLARLFGMLFETDKNFLLPSAVPSLREIRRLYEVSSPSELLIVGHTDTAGTPAHNDELSLERADAVAAYLLDQSDVWLARYQEGVVANKRWGSREDLLMLTAMPDFPTKPPDEDAIRWFQRTRNLAMDGIAGPKTRTQLIKEYMLLDGVTLADEPDLRINITTHGCGEHFPLDETTDELDTAPADDTEDARDRRVELYFFDSEFGIIPPPPGKSSKAGSTQYPEWRKRAEKTLDFDTSDTAEATCHLSFVLNDEATQAPKEFAVVRFEVQPGVPVTVQTDHTGVFEFGDVVPGDYELDVDGVKITVSALAKTEARLPLLLRPDPALT